MTGNGWQLPDDALPPRCPCDACRDLGAALDADLLARLAVTVAAEAVDRAHRLSGQQARRRDADAEERRRG